MQRWAGLLNRGGRDDENPLSIALSSQHARLADRAVGDAGPARAAG